MFKRVFIPSSIRPEKQAKQSTLHPLKRAPSTMGGGTRASLEEDRVYLLLIEVKLSTGISCLFIRACAISEIGSGPPMRFTLNFTNQRETSTRRRIERSQNRTEIYQNDPFNYTLASTKGKVLCEVITLSGYFLLQFPVTLRSSIHAWTTPLKTLSRTNVSEIN
jgi:hypothetical protein